MAETTPYFGAILAHRSILVDENEFLAGGTTVSPETQKDLVESDILTLVQYNLASFLRALRFLPRDDQESLLTTWFEQIAWKFWHDIPNTLPAHGFVTCGLPLEIQRQKDCKDSGCEEAITVRW